MFNNSDIKDYADAFGDCTLASLNERAAMLSRIDNKYILTADQLNELKPLFSENFDVLQIGSKRVFKYATRYFDTESRSAYYEHHQGKRKGFKVRVRRYLDAGLCFVELKMKKARGMTIKLRKDYDFDSYVDLDKSGLQFVKNEYQNHYEKPFEYNLQAAMDITYDRLTLVAKNGNARMTIDTNLSFQNSTLKRFAPKGFYIVETKSINGRGLADRCLRQFNHRPVKRCSKYCMGMAALNEVSRFNHFLPTMQKLHIWDQVAVPLSAQSMATT